MQSASAMCISSTDILDLKYFGCTVKDPILIKKKTTLNLRYKIEHILSCFAALIEITD